MWFYEPPNYCTTTAMVEKLLLNWKLINSDSCVEDDQIYLEMKVHLLQNIAKSKPRLINAQYFKQFCYF